MRRTIRTGRASRLGRRIRKTYDVLSALLSALFSAVYSLVDSGERRNPVGPGTSVSGGERGRTRCM